LYIAIELLYLTATCGVKEMSRGDGHKDDRGDLKRRKVDSPSSSSDSELSVHSDSGVHSDSSGSGSLSARHFAKNYLDLVIDVSDEKRTNAFPALVVEVVDHMPGSEQKKDALPVGFSPIKNPTKHSDMTPRTAAKIDAGADAPGYTMTRGKNIGQGAYGEVTVSRMTYGDFEGRFARKMLFDSCDPEADIVEMLGDVPYMVKAEGGFRRGALFMPLQPRGALDRYIDKVVSYVSSDELGHKQAAVRFIYQVVENTAKALKHIHTHDYDDNNIKYVNPLDPEGEGQSSASQRPASPVIHHDVKLSNLLVSGDGDEIGVLVSDLGSARTVVATREHVLCGTISSFAPEKHFHQCKKTVPEASMVCKYDVWSLGIVLHQLLNMPLPFDANDLFEYAIGARNYLGVPGRESLEDIDICELGKDGAYQAALAEKFKEKITCLGRLRNNNYPDETESISILSDLAKACVLPDLFRPTSTEVVQICQIHGPVFSAVDKAQWTAFENSLFSDVVASAQHNQQRNNA
jgi:hypothetical protein